MAAKKTSSTDNVATKPGPVAAMAVAPTGVSSGPASTPAAVKPVTATTAATATLAAPAVASMLATPAAPARDRSSIVALISRLRDPDAEVARDAAQTLATLPVDAEAVDALCAAVRNTDGYHHPVVRAAAATTLGKLGERRAVESLIAGTRDTMAEASEEAVKALGLLGDSRAIAALDAIVSNTNHFFLETVRRAAVEAKARISTRAKA